MLRRIAVLFFCLVLLWCAGCSSSQPTFAPPMVSTDTRQQDPTAFHKSATEDRASATSLPSATSAPSPTQKPSIQRVMIVSIDGLRADSLQQADVPSIGALEYDAAVSFTAQTVYPSVTLPAHTSMLSGVCVPKHGITWNGEFNGTYVAVDTVFSIAHQAGMRTVMVVGKDKLKTISRPGTVDQYEYVAASDEEIAGQAVRAMTPGFGILFVHLPEVDGMGHDRGWNSPDYYSVIHRADTAVGILIDGLHSNGLTEGTLIIVTADHGGHGTTHGTLLPEDMTIPWIIYGPGVKPSRLGKIKISTTDTAATTLWALGLSIPSGWDGRPVVEAFDLTAAQENVPAGVEGRCRK
jgi:predicted AlkP superfamily pyrophosphatase or phosphodiesterase